MCGVKDMMRPLQQMIVYVGAAVLLVLAGGCSIKPRVRVSLDQFIQAPSSYEKYDVIISATIADVAERPDQYKGKTVEVTAPFTYYGSKSFWTWYILLEENGVQLRCFTHYYRLYAGWDAENLLMWARSEHGKLTVLGTLEKDGLDIQEIMYKDQIARPDFKPMRPYLFIGGGYPYY
jgi:hypothetical protein